VETEQLTWSAGGGWRPSAGVCNEARLVLYFGACDALGTDTGDCDPHNRTMTITVISEVAA
jgi:hypothetical protein